MTNTQKLYLILTILIFISLSCDSGVEPGKNLNPREFVWTVDTIDNNGASQILMKNICGNSSEDFWISGHSSGLDGKIWHYFNKGLHLVPTTEYTHRLSNYIYSSDSAPDGTICFVGEYTQYNNSGDILKPFVCIYNDGNWVTPSLPGENEELYDVCVVNKNEIYAVGSWGSIWHFDGVKWENERLKLIEGKDLNYKIISVVNKKDIIHLLVKTFDIKDEINYWYVTGKKGKWEIKNHNLYKIPGGSHTFGHMGLFSSDFGKIYSYDSEVYELNGSNWEGICSDLDKSTNLSGICGYSEENLIFLTALKKPEHWNGTNLMELKNFPDASNLVLNDIKIFENKILIVGYKNSKSFLFIGSSK